MLSKTFSVMIVISVICAVLTGNIDRLSFEFVNSLSSAVNLIISLCGMMCFWSGLMSVFERAGAIDKLSRLLKPVFRLIYPDKNMSSKTVNNLSSCFAANFLGLGNAALPLGIRAVDSMSGGSDTANDNVIMFAVLATVPFQLIPSTLIALRSKYGSANPFDVLPAIWVTSIAVNIFAVVLCRCFSKIWRNGVK